MRFTILALRPVVREYDVGSVAKLRRLGGGKPKMTAAFVLHATLGMRLDEIALVLRTTVEDVCNLQRLIAVLLYRDRKVYEVIRRCARAADVAVDAEMNRGERVPL